MLLSRRDPRLSEDKLGTDFAELSVVDTATVFPELVERFDERLKEEFDLDV
jgi:hypothetical protein